MVANSLSRLLEAWDYETLIAYNGQKAIDLCREHIEELVLLLTDGDMPKKHGLEVAAEVRKMSENVKIILLSGSLHVGTNQAAADAAVANGDLNAYLAKPYLVKVLRTKINEVLEA